MHWSGVRVVVTGGSGFVGTNAVEHFSTLGAQVFNLDVLPPRNSAHVEAWRRCDILDHVSLAKAIRALDPHYVIHLAARTDLLEVKDIRAYEVNYEGTRRLIDACSGCGQLKRVVVASSRMVCRIGYAPKHDTDYCPPNLYGESKVRTEQVVRDARPPFEWVIVRPTSIWGPWFDVPYKTFFTTIANRTYLQPRGHNPPKSFGFVGNAVYQYERLLLASRGDVAGVTTYQCDYPPLHLVEWADSIRRAMNLRPIPTAPVPLLRVLARVGDGLAKLGWTQVPLTTFRLENLLAPMVFDTTVLARVCGVLPFTLHQGIAQTVAWLRQN